LGAPETRWWRRAETKNMAFTEAVRTFSEGASVGSHDLLIGATAIALGYRVATRDRRSFGKIPGLDVLVL
jgi:predicted nucleic acid-binding protein